MTTLRDIDPFFPELLQQAQSDGLVTVREHPEFPLFIANYTPKAQYDREWNVVTKACRGLIFDDEDRVVARPFPKFFNWDEFSVKIPAGNALVSNKYDGSLGILYWWDGQYYVASRGSFTSEQAQRGTKIFRDIYEDYERPLFEPDCTYLFEIIYPENRIVVDYGEQETLVLIDVIDDHTGRARQDLFDDLLWPDKAERRLLPVFHHTLVEQIADNEEGFVLYWPHHDLRVKMKGPEYVRLHKIITNVSARVVWEYLAAGRPLDALLENVPDEFYQWVKETATDLSKRYYVRLAEIESQFAQAQLLSITEDDFLGNPRKAFAKYAKQSNHPSALFALYDKRDVADYIWKTLRPEHTKPFWSGDE